MINKFLTDIKIIKKAINTKKLVVFAGAGISIDAGVPSWGKLIEELKKDLDLPEDENDFLKIPQIYFNERQEKEYVEKIRKVLEHKTIKHNEIHEALFDLNPEHILTTNFEDLLEQVVNKKSLPYSIVREDNDLPYSNNTKLLVKIHGDLDKTDFVLKEDDYLNYSKNHPLIEAFIKSVFASKVVLFIGYSFNDYNLKQIVQNVRNILGGNFQNAYLLSIDENLHFSHREYLKNKGINVIDYSDSLYVDSKKTKSNYIEDFLNGHNIYNEIYPKKGENLSDKGKLLLNFLQFIIKYDELKIEVTQKNVIDQLYNSLSRFSELKSLPQSFLTKLYPIKANRENESLIDRTTLLLKNEIVADLFYNNIVIEGKDLKYISNEKVNEKKVNENKRKLLIIIKKLNNSLIFNVTKEREKADSLGYKGMSSDVKYIHLKDETICNCTKCKYDRFEFNEVLKDLNSYSINDKTDIKDDLRNAYLNYKIGNYFQSCNMFEEIATKAWNSGKHITYYIAVKNRKTLKNLIRIHENILDKKKQDLIEEIEGIDIDKLIFQIPYNSDEEFLLLKIIRDDKVLQDYIDEINDLYDNVEGLYTSFKSQYFNSHGPYYPHLIYLELYKTINFYVENYIVIDVFSDFKKIIEKGIKALILNHIINDSYDQRLDSLSSDFFRFAVRYCNPDDLYKFLDKYKVQSLKFGEEDSDVIVQYCINYFQSFYNLSTLFSSDSYKNESVFTQLSNQSFGNSMSNTFSNMMLLMISIDIPKQHRLKFTNGLIAFLQHENFLHWNNLKYLKVFINLKPELFTRNELIKLLDIIQDNIKKYNSIGILKAIAFAFKENKFDLIEDKKLIFKILTNYDYKKSNESAIVSLWKISNNTIKKELETIIISRLNEKFDEKLYVDACYEEVIDYNLFFEEFIKSLDVHYSSGTGEIYSMRNGKPKFHSFVFHNSLIFLYFLNIKSNDERLKLFKHTTDLMKFFLFREKSDLSKFKIEWLLLFNNEIIFNEISKIKKLKTIIKDSLKENYDKKIASIYTKYFL